MSRHRLENCPRLTLCLGQGCPTKPQCCCRAQELPTPSSALSQSGSSSSRCSLTSSLLCWHFLVYKYQSKDLFCFAGCHPVRAKLSHVVLPSTTNSVQYSVRSPATELSSYIWSVKTCEAPTLQQKADHGLAEHTSSCLPPQDAAPC